MVALVGCTKADSETDSAPDTYVPNEGPILAHTPPDSLIDGQPVTLTIDATDSETVEQVTLYWRSIGESAWSTAYLPRVSVDTFAVELEGAQIDAPALEYYFRAQDAEPVPAVSYLPDNGLNPYVVGVTVVGQALPFEEGFEDAGLLGLFDLGWNLVSDGFPGYSFEVTDAEVHTGLAAARHKRGVDGLGEPLSDWMITPALDFTEATEVELTWYEYGDLAELADHSIWVSTTSGDPADGGFVEVLALDPPPEHAWGRSPIVELTEFAGNPAVWVAFKYEGDFADAWYIDDVAIGPLGPELAETGFVGPSEVVSPGDTASLALSVRNLTSKPTGPLMVTWTVDNGAGTFAGNPFDVPSIDGGATSTFTAALQISPDFTDNTPVTVRIEATNGAETWAWDESFLVGEPTVGTVRLTAGAAGLIQAWIGHGAPGAPDVEVPVVSEAASPGAHVYTVDLTEYAAQMPPGPGPDRWWLRVEAAEGGTLTGFDLAWDGTTYVGDDLGAYAGDTARVFYLPKPPKPLVLNGQTTPSPATPGGTVDWTGTLVNAGAPTVGETTVVLTSDDPDVTITTTDPVVLADDAWSEDTPVPLSFRFDIAATHTSSTPVDLLLVVTDTVESFEIPVHVNVPWPVLVVNHVEIVDRNQGDNDDLLDPGERANLKIYLANVGGLATSGSVDCDLADTGGGASADILVASGNFGVLGPNTMRDENAFEIDVTAGAVGDSLLFELTCTDNTRTFDVPFDVQLGRPLWRSLSVSPDALGDNDDYPFDYRRGWWRTDGQTLEFRFDSAVAYDDSLFLEAWIESLGSDWSYYQFVMQSGVPKLRAADFFGVFVTLPTVPEVRYVDADTIEVAFDLEAFGLFFDQVAIGWAAGFCGGEDHYCDQYPENWGYGNGFEWPGTTLDTNAMFTLSW